MDVTEASGIRCVNVPARRPLRLVESVGFGGGFLDFDQDGFQDVICRQRAALPALPQPADGKFVDVTAGSGLEAKGDWIGCAVCDYDNDGYPDLYVTGFHKSALYHNQRNGTFKDVTDRAGAGMAGKWAVAATFADFDRDGLPDLYVGTYCQFGPNSRHYCVLHQNGIRPAAAPSTTTPRSAIASATAATAPSRT